ncbi:MAG TPA: glutathione S-transferase family protein [Polyangiales bacterium]|nr:glutathione S-transferase family protein [Polyangiales bacterium]
MSELVLWGFPKSSNVQKVLWALDELGLKYEHKEIGGPFGGTKEAPYLALNPNGLVPTLVDHGEPLWESHAIVRHLYAQHGQSPANPSSAVARARAGAWHDWQATTLWPALRTLMIQIVRTPEPERDQKVIDTARAQADAALAVLEGELSKRAYLAGEEFTWGDIPVAVALQRWFNFPITRQQTKHVSDYYARIQKRPAFKRWVDL